MNHNVDTLMISRTKTDETFPETRSCIDGYSTPSHFDRNSYSGGFFYTSENYKTLLKYFSKEMNLRKMCLLGVSCNHHKGNISFHVNCLSQTLDCLIATYKNILLTQILILNSNRNQRSKHVRSLK